MRYKNKGKFLLSLGVVTLVLLSTSYVYFFLASSKSDFTSKAASCSVDARLVNSCRPWLGATVDGYSQVSGDKAAQFAYAEKRLNDPSVLDSPGKVVAINRKLDFVHFFHPVGNDVLTSTEKSYINRANTYAIINWKPTDVWAQADGTNATVNQRINSIADSIKSVAPKKIIFTLYHEPEDNVSKKPDACAGTQLKADASSGSPVEYRRMWQTVRDRFNARGVTNVVWAMNYMGYSGWDCLVPYLWPGNNLVDWVLWDPYAHSAITFESSVSRFYNHLSSTSNIDHNYSSKIWGIAEHGFGNKNGDSTQAQAIGYWDQARTAIVNNKFPKIKLYTVFDTNVNGDSQVGMTFGGQSAPSEQTAFNAYAAAMQAIGSNTTNGGGGTSGGTTNGGTSGGGSTTSPKPNSGSGTVRTSTGQQVTNVQNDANINQGELVTLDESTVSNSEVVKVEFYLNGELYQTVEQEPFVLDTSDLEPGSYDVTQKTFFKDGTTSEETRVIEVASAQGTGEDSSANKAQTIILLAISLLFGLLVILYLAWFIFMRPKGYTIAESIGMVGYFIKQLAPFKRKPKTPTNYMVDYDATQVSAPRPDLPPPASHKFPWR